MTETKTSPSEWIDGYGYEYESAKALLLREKAPTQRNRSVENLYTLGRPQGYVLAWCEGYEASLKEQARKAEASALKGRLQAIERQEADFALRTLNRHIIARCAGESNAIAWKDKHQPTFARFIQGPS